MNSADAGTPRKHCLLCGTVRDPLYSALRDRICGTPGEFTVRECAKCGLAWLDGEPATEPHGEGYYTHVADHERLAQQADTSPLARAALTTRLGYTGDAGTTGRLLAMLPPWRERCEALALFLPAVTAGRLLDVGCGNGVFAARMRSLGWDVMCVEPDPRAATAARGAFGLTVHSGTLESAALPSGSFDAIALGHVIEHVPDPIATLAECRRLLKPGGQLVAVTPNIRSLGRRMFGRHWMHWDVPRHRYLFSPDSLVEVARRAGLRTVQARTSARGARWAWRRSRQLTRHPVVADNGGAGTSRGPAAIAFQLAETALASWSHAGEECLVLATVES
ncbi:MAG: class I SAM-dependent methyltransferase [Gemmatimonadetes bacterium]|nr:class I SAM-dependent methyltransferase [Gemmatimonadota bacterium]